jgi:hypothetical protein
MNIKDLAVAKELSHEERAAVRGGSNAALLFGPAQYAQNGGGFSFASPVIQVAPQTVTQTDTTVDLASVLASMGTAISQAKLA